MSNVMNMSNLWSDYKKTLKNAKVEEFLDLVIYRPLAFILVKIFFHTSLTPNHVSAMALLSGCCSSYFYAQGTPTGFMWGAICFAFFGVLDCCDGMLARLKGNGHPLGRLIDGFVDYLVNLLVFLGIGIGLGRSMDMTITVSPLFFVLACGLSKALHAMTFDFYLYEYLGFASQKCFSSADEIEHWQKTLEELKKRKGKGLGWQRLLIALYIGFCRLQLGREKKRRPFNPKIYCQKNVLTLQLWGIIGPATNGTVLIIASFLQKPMIYFYFSFIFANIWMVVVSLLQSFINSSTELLSSTEGQKAGA